MTKKKKNTSVNRRHCTVNRRKKTVAESLTDNNQPITNMEVHKHPHHVTHKKKWGEYFLEFLMIFLAVIMGFIAENIREHQTEKKIGRELIHSLVDDLKADTAGFDDNAQFWTTRLKGIDSLRYYIQPLIKISNTGRTYYWVEQMFEFTDFKYHDATIQQLRNTGNFRLIEKRNIIDSLIAYDGSIKSLYLNVENTARSQYLFLRHMQAKLFNSSYFKRFSSQLPDTTNIGRSFSFQNKSNSIFEYYNELYNYKHLVAVLTLNDNNFHSQATRLIELIQKEYELKNE